MFGRNFYGRGRGGGRGFGFRGSSPPWPYVGRGRGGLPRCGYYFGRTGWSVPPYYRSQPYYSGVSFSDRYATSYPQKTREEELIDLKEQAEVIKKELDEIESRMRDIEPQG